MHISKSFQQRMLHEETKMSRVFPEKKCFHHKKYFFSLSIGVYSFSSKSYCKNHSFLTLLVTEIY